MNAYDLADRLEQFYTGTHIQKAAEELRKLQKENEELKESLRKAQEKWKTITHYPLLSYAD